VVYAKEEGDLAQMFQAPLPGDLMLVTDHPGEKKKGKCDSQQQPEDEEEHT